MDKTVVKNFAVSACKKLKEQIVQKAYELGVAAAGIKEPEEVAGGFSIQGKVLDKRGIRQWQQLVQGVKEKGFDQIVEEAAYRLV